MIKIKIKFSNTFMNYYNLLFSGILTI